MERFAHSPVFSRFRSRTCRTAVQRLVVGALLPGASAVAENLDFRLDPEAGNRSEVTLGILIEVREGALE